MNYKHLKERFCLLAFYLYLLVDVGKPLSMSIEGGRREYSKVVEEGTSPILTCNYKLDDPLAIKRIVWKFNPLSQPTNINFIVYGSVLKKYADRYVLTGYKAHLKVLNVSRTQVGTYTCEVSAPNEVPSHGKGKYNLTVVARPAKPVCQYSSLRVKIGETARFNCSSKDGIPKPKYAWYKDSMRLPQDRTMYPRFDDMSYTYNDTTGTILFSSFSKYDAGKYYCSALNRVGEEKCLAFHVEAYSDEANKTNAVQKSTTTATSTKIPITATEHTIENNEALLVAYEKNQTNAAETATQSTKTANTTTSNYEPSSNPRENQIIHAVGTGRPLKVSIEGGRTTYAKEVVEGTSPVLRCHYTTSNPTGEKRISWSYSPISQPKNITFIAWRTVLDRFTDKFLLTGNKANLQILNVSRSHVGIYTCEISAPHEIPSHGKGVYTISVAVVPTKPTCSFSNFRVKVGQTARFTCNSKDGVPTPKYAWYRDSTKLPLSSRFRRTSYKFNETTGTIFFMKFTHDDEGNYTCSAYNRAGEKRCSSFYVDAYPAEVCSSAISQKTTATKMHISQKTTPTKIHIADKTTEAPKGANTPSGGNDGSFDSRRGGATRTCASLAGVVFSLLLGKLLT